jgi:hypothetical protein
VVYPFILNRFAWLPWTSADTSILKHVPQVLGQLSGPLGPILSLSGGRKAGPLSVMALGLGVGAVVFWVGTLSRRRQEKISTSDKMGSAAVPSSPVGVT